jgi:hypothetical protein
MAPELNIEVRLTGPERISTQETGLNTLKPWTWKLHWETAPAQVRIGTVFRGCCYTEWH